jgi:O-antigen/teichoic acid export membrane protein
MMMICLSALPRPFAEASSQLLRAVGLSKAELYANMTLTGLLGVFLLIGVVGGIYGVAAAVLLAHIFFMPPYSIWAYRHACKMH